MSVFNTTEQKLKNYLNGKSYIYKFFYNIKYQTQKNLVQGHRVIPDQGSETNFSLTEHLTILAFCW